MRARLVGFALSCFYKTYTPKGFTTCPSLKKDSMKTPATGTFTTKLDSPPPFDTTDGVSLGRSTVEKVFSGDLTATSTVHMLGARTPIPNSAGYVAVERITGTLRGKAGSFVVLHTGLMNRGEFSLVISIVPDSGTLELAGISGSMKIIFEQGKHSYLLEYEL